MGLIIFHPLEYNNSQIGTRIQNYLVKMGSSKLLMEKTDALELEKFMNMETVNANLNKESDVSEEKLINHCRY